MIETTGNFTSIELLAQENLASLDQVDLAIAELIGERAVALGMEGNLPITISVELDGQEVFRRALPGATDEQAGWIARKSNVVNLTHHSTMYERVKAEEEGLDWHARHGVVDETHAIHGGGFPLLTKCGEFKGVLLMSGLPQVEDHLFVFEVLRKYNDGNS